MAFLQSVDAGVLQSGPALTLSVLGPLSFSSARERLPVRGHSKSQGLLTCMALFHRDAAPREQILEQLWPEQSSNLAVQALNSVTSELNKFCRRHFDCPNLILYERGYYRFNTEAGVGLDIELFESDARQGCRLLAQGNAEEGLAQCKQALAYYRGDLSGDASLRALIVREHLRALSRR